MKNTVLRFRQLYTNENINISIIFYFCQNIPLNPTHWSFKLLLMNLHTVPIELTAQNKYNKVDNKHKTK